MLRHCAFRYSTLPATVLILPSSAAAATTTVRVPLAHYVRLTQFNAAAFGLLVGLFREGEVEATKVGALSKTQLNAFIDSNI